MGRGLNLKMMIFLEASMLEVYGTRMIVIFRPLKLGRSFICQTQDLEKNWQVVQTFEHMHLYNVSQTEMVQYNSPAYQEDDYCEEECMWKSVSDNTYDKPLNEDDEQGPIFEVAEIVRLLKVREKEVHDESKDENEKDDTLFQYCSEDEGGSTAEVDSDDE
jgi:hypothetical protein